MRAQILGALAVLVPNAIRDLRRHEIFPRYTLLLGGAGALFRLFLFRDPLPAVIGGLLPGLFLLSFSLASRGGIGAGDGLAVIALGIWTSIWETLLAVTFGLGLLGFSAIALSISGRRKKEYPFVPFLLAGQILTRILV